MPHDQALREHLIYLIEDGGAHIDFDAAIQPFTPKYRGIRPPGSAHSPWELLEHMRLALWDILEFSRNPHHVSPDFPTGYWPAGPAPPNEKAWDEAAEAFRELMRQLSSLVEDPSTDLFAKIPHGDGQTILREVLVAADHNAYHLGALVALARLLGART